MYTPYKIGSEGYTFIAKIITFWVIAKNDHLFYIISQVAVDCFQKKSNIIFSNFMNLVCFKLWDSHISEFECKTRALQPGLPEHCNCASTANMLLPVVHEHCSQHCRKLLLQHWQQHFCSVIYIIEMRCNCASPIPNTNRTDSTDSSATAVRTAKALKYSCICTTANALLMCFPRVRGLRVWHEWWIRYNFLLK